MQWKDVAKWVAELIITFIAWQLFDYVQVLLSNAYGQSASLSTKDVVLGIVGLGLIIVAVSVGIHGLWSFFSWKKDRKYFEKVQAYIFFPDCTPNDDLNLNYHEKYLHHKVIVNFKNNPPMAYFMSTSSDVYKLVKKHKKWVHELGDVPNDKQFIDKWCKEKGYLLQPFDAPKEELLRASVLEAPKQESRLKAKEPAMEKLLKLYDEEQLRYRSQLKEEINQMRLELDNVENPKGISYPIWLCDHDPERRRKLIGNNREHDVIQKFYTAIENRNRYQSSMHRPDAEFARLNAKCIDAYCTVMKEVIWQSEEESDLRQTGKELLQALYFFLEHWATYKRLMKADSWRLESPQKGEIKWCSDQIKFAVIKARTLSFGRINAVIDQIEAISNDMAELGMSVLQQFPVPFSAYDLERGEIQRLIVRGDVICKKLKQVIQIVEQNFIKKGKIEDVSNMLAEISKADKMDKPCMAEEPDMKQTRHENAKEIAKMSAEESKLMEVYSPIHAMIVRVNREIPREVALNGTVGAWVRASLIDFKDVSAVFNQHNDKLRKKDLDTWLEIEKEIKVRNGFWLNKDRQTWFDELEAEYNRLIKHQ